MCKMGNLKKVTMKKQINLFFDFEFTSLSPDAQPISLGIVSSSNVNGEKYPIGIVGWDKRSAIWEAEKRGLNIRDNKECVLLYRPEHFCSWVFKEIVIPEQVLSLEKGYILSGDMSFLLEHAQKHQVVKDEVLETKQFYAEFSDFDLNRCDDWVKENIVAKLKWWNNKDVAHFKDDSTLRLGIDGEHFGSFEGIKHNLKHWLEQFKDYHIQFVCDCGTFDFYYLLRLIGEWDDKPIETEKEDVINDWLYPLGIDVAGLGECHGIFTNRIGLPKLPPNISPVPQDLNCLIATKKGISVKEAFELNREGLIYPTEKGGTMCYNPNDKHNALWDAKVIKAIYESLK